MISEPFAIGDSLLHRTDPAVKIISALLLSISIAVSFSLRVAGAGLAVGILLAVMARLPLLPLGKRLAAVNLFTLLLWITLPLTGGGEHTSLLGPLQLSSGGLELALLITLKTNGIYLILTALMTTSTITAIGHALQRLRLPHKLILLFLATYRYLGLIEQEYRRLRRSAALRCFKASSSLHAYRTYGYLIGMTLIRSYARSRRVHQAMLMRGFQGNFPLLARQKIRPCDLWLLAACGLIALTLALGPVFW
jgi:cobalt/nickel transport system permease protein